MVVARRPDGCPIRAADRTAPRRLTGPIRAADPDRSARQTRTRPGRDGFLPGLALDTAVSDGDPDARPFWAVGQALAVGVGLGAAWGLVAAGQLGGDPEAAVALGALGGSVIALVAAYVVYRAATR